MDMMYMDDAIEGIVKLMNADADRLEHRNSFNITAMSLNQNNCRINTCRRIPDFELKYDVDPVRQRKKSLIHGQIRSMTVMLVKNGTSVKLDLDKMTDEMLERLSEKFKAEGIKNKSVF